MNNMDNVQDLLETIARCTAELERDPDKFRNHNCRDISRQHSQSPDPAVCRIGESVQGCARQREKHQQHQSRKSELQVKGLAGFADSDESHMKYGQAVYEMELFKNEPRLQFLHGPHAPYSCMADYLQKLTASARDRGIGQTIHLSESQAEMDSIRKEHAATPIAYVDSLGVFDVPVIAAHCVYATDEDIRLMAEKGVSVALCPKSNMKLGNGFAPAQKLLDAGINVCLGTDGCGSNNSLNMFSEMNAAALVYKGAEHRAQCVSAAEVLKMATVNSAKAIGREGELGVIREGALADLILVNLAEPQFLPHNSILSGLVYSSTGAEVDTVLVNGEILMENKTLTTIDESRVYAECQKIMNRIKTA